LLQLLEESDDQVDLVDFIQSILRRSPLSLDFETVVAITEIICGRCDAAWTRGDVESCKRCLSFFHVLATHKLEHAASTSSSLRTLCCMVNADGHATWSIMKHLLNGKAGFQVLRGLIHLLENPQNNSQWVLRGAVFFVGMSCWGSQRITKLDIGWAAILLALESVLECHDGVVIFEVILSIQRLIKKYGEAMNIEWDIILQIFAKLSPWLAVNEEEEQKRGEYHLEQVNRSPSAKEVYLLDAGMPSANNFLVGTVAANEQSSHTTDGNGSASLNDPFDVTIQQTRIPKELLDTPSSIYHI
jgi:tuberous sclerosis protein 2